MVKSTRSDLLALLPDDARTGQAVAAYDLVQDLTAQLKALRNGAGMSQKQLAQRLGVSQGRISQLESGLMDDAPSLEMVGRYAEACDGQVDFQVRSKADAAALSTEVAEDHTEFTVVLTAGVDKIEAVRDVLRDLGLDEAVAQVEGAPHVFVEKSG